jgi:hypothetical protein
VIAFKIFVAKFPVTEIFEAVVLPSVELPVVNKLPNAPIPVTVVDAALRAVTAPVPAVKFARVVDASVEEEPATKFVTKRVVEVALVIVPLVALILDNDKLPALNVVIVAFVMVAFVPIAFTKLDVDAFVVVE